MGTILLGSGFLFLFLYSLTGTVIQYLTLKKSIRHGIRIYGPELPVTCGEETIFRYEAMSPSFLMPGFYCRLTAELTWMNRHIRLGLPLGPGQEPSGSISTVPEKRGAYTCSSCGIETGDIPGFFRLKLEPGCECPVDVNLVADENTINERPPARGGVTAARVSRKKRNEDMIESRVYYPGDDIRRLNWKQYAHSGDLFIRIGEEVPLPEERLLLVADLSCCFEPDGEYRDLLDIYLDETVGKLMSMCRLYADAGIEVNLAVYPQAPVVPTEKLYPGLWWDAGSTGEAVSADSTVFADSFKSWNIDRRFKSAVLLTTAVTRNAAGAVRRMNTAGLDVHPVISLKAGDSRDYSRSLLSSVFFRKPAEEQLAGKLQRQSLSVNSRAQTVGSELSAAGGRFVRFF